MKRSPKTIDKNEQRISDHEDKSKKILTHTYSKINRTLTKDYGHISETTVYRHIEGKNPSTEFSDF